MTPEFVITVGREAMTTAFFIAAPPLIAALVVGLVVSIFQAVTQIQEQTLTFVPKLGAIVFVIFALMPWLMQQLVEFLIEVLRAIPVVTT